MKKSRRMCEKQLALKAKTQPKLFFAHVRRNRHLKKNIIGLKDNEGETIFTPSAQAELLKNFYSSIFRKDNGLLAKMKSFGLGDVVVRWNRRLKKSIIGLKDNVGETPSAQAELLKNFFSSIFCEDDPRPTPPLPVPTVVMPVPQLSISVVHRELSSLDISKGAGPDDINPQMVRWLAEFLAEPLSKLFANSLTTAVVPTDWRLAIKCPIHKKGIQRMFPTTAPWVSLL